MYIRILTIFLLAALFSSCSMFEYNPNDLELTEEEKNLTAKNLARLSNQSPGDTVLMIFTGDTQRFYDDTKAFVDKVNSRPKGDFVVISGDISDFGLPAEFRWMNEIYSGLNIPYLTVIGNHDMLGNGRQIYLEMFGALDYSFTYGRHHFIMANTNGREYGFNGAIPDTAFLRQRLNADQDQTSSILICHVPAENIDFDPALFEPVKNILTSNGNVIAAFHGHTHGYSLGYPFGNNIPVISSSSTSQRNYLEVRFYNDARQSKDTFIVQQIFY